MAHLAMAIACLSAKPRAGLVMNSEKAIKIVIHNALTIFVNDIRQLMEHHVEKSIKGLLGHHDPHIASHALERRQELRKWLKVKAPLAWLPGAGSNGNLTSLSMMLCEDPNAENLILVPSHITYEAMVNNLINFTG